MDCLIRERNGVEEIWYSDEYLKRQMELAYYAGLSRGIRVDFYAVSPINNDEVDNLVNEFKQRVEEEFKIAIEKGEIWKVK